MELTRPRHLKAQYTNSQHHECCSWWTDTKLEKHLNFYLVVRFKFYTIFVQTWEQKTSTVLLLLFFFKRLLFCFSKSLLHDYYFKVTFTDKLVEWYRWRGTVVIYVQVQSIVKKRKEKKCSFIQVTFLCPLPLPRPDTTSKSSKVHIKTQLTSLCAMSHSMGSLYRNVYI